jgi:hypothetical protein
VPSHPCSMISHETGGDRPSRQAQLGPSTPPHHGRPSLLHQPPRRVPNPPSFDPRFQPPPPKKKMVIGLLTLTAIPVVTGVAEGVSHQRSAAERRADDRRMAKFYIDIYCDAKSPLTKYVHGRRVVLREGKVWIDEHAAQLRSVASYTAKAFYLVYPDDEVRYLIMRDLAARGLISRAEEQQQRNPPPLGLVSQVQDDPPLLNWIYVDKATMELRYGNRTVSKEHHVGPWDWTEDDDDDDEPLEPGEANKGVTFEGWEGFTAVEDPHSKEWQVYFDKNDDGLKGYVGRERRMLQISLERTMVAQAEDDLNVRNQDNTTNVRGMTGGVAVMGNSAQTNNVTHNVTHRR